MSKYKFDYCKKCGCKLLYKEEYDTCISCSIGEQRNEGKLICPGTVFLKLQSYTFRDKND